MLKVESDRLVEGKGLFRNRRVNDILLRDGGLKGFKEIKVNVIF